MDQEKYSLTWKTHSEHLRKMLREMFHSDEFSDVTLVCEDMKQFRAHKNILAACSPLFHSLLQSDKSGSSTVYLKGVLHSEMEALLNFIYLGETSVNVERTDSFLSTAKSLEIRELCSDKEENCIETFQNISTCQLETEEDDDSDSEQDNYVHETDEPLKIFHQEEQAPKRTRRQPYKHYDIIQVGDKYKCLICDKLYVRRSHAIEHKKVAHGGVTYNCDQCTYKTGRQGDLKIHIKAIHENIKLPCNLCDKEFSKATGLRNHINAIHEGTKFNSNIRKATS